MLYLDFETYSESDITKVGAYRYAEDPSTEALMLGWAIDDGPVQLLNCHHADPYELARECHELRILLEKPETLISAFNATFERLILKHCLGIDIPASKFRCTMALAYSFAFTGGLDDVLQQFNLGIGKDSKGKSLIRRFSKPQPKNQKVSRWTAENDPEGYAEFMEYCKQDVEVERKLRKALERYPFHAPEQGLYTLDQKINDAGVPVDKKLIAAALEINELERAHLIERLGDLTGLSNPNSNAQLQGWLADQGLVLENMQKQTIEDQLKVAGTSNTQKALEIKQDLAKTSVSKWSAFDRSRCSDDTCKGMFAFAGASRTNRWAGRLVQLQNLARGGNTTKDPSQLAEMMLLPNGYEVVQTLYGSPMMALSDTIRAAITAPEGKMLVVSDLSSIESRVLGWLADCGRINEGFAKGLDTYKVFASGFYGIPYDQVTKEQRTFSKPPVLGGGYGLGGKGMIAYAEGMGVSMTEEEGQAAVDAFRQMYPEIVQFWAWCKDAVFYTTRTGNSCRGKHGIMTFARGEFLLLRLPSGRNIAYYQPKIEQRKAPWGDMIDNFTFMGKDRFTNQWTRISAHPGFLCENLVQAIARDILAVWMTRADAAGFDIRGSVHDELICVEETDRVEELNELIRKPIEWADGLLLDADGYCAKRYRKD